ncbi:hypothetical protein U3516DRAFT_735318 [Neocallimastix sp. 'constans']
MTYCICMPFNNNHRYIQTSLQNIQQKKKPLTNTKKIAETSSTTKNDILVEEILEISNIDDDSIIKLSSNESHSKILHENAKKINGNNGIFKINSDKNRKTDSDDENESHNRINNINTINPEIFEEVTNSENVDKMEKCNTQKILIILITIIPEIFEEVTNSENVDKMEKCNKQKISKFIWK